MLDKSNAPIGVFDSGVGGLTVAVEIMRQMPLESIVYFGDTARVPYGGKSKDTIIKYARQIINFLKTKEVKAIVIACNTASAYALDTLVDENDLPIIGVIHAGAVQATRVTNNKRIGVIGTKGTVSSGIYPKFIKNIDKEIEVTQKACPLLCPLVEEGLMHDNVTDEIISRYVTELKSKYIDTLVLGCTHYPLLKPAIAKIMGESVNLVDPAYETALELSKLLDRYNIKKNNKTNAEYEFYVSDLAESFQDFASMILPNEVKNTKKINIEEY